VFIYVFRIALAQEIGNALILVIVNALEVLTIAMAAASKILVAVAAETIRACNMEMAVIDLPEEERILPEIREEDPGADHHNSSQNNY
jgi:hypothetical protein